MNLIKAVLIVKAELQSCINLIYIWKHLSRGHGLNGNRRKILEVRNLHFLIIFISFSMALFQLIWNRSLWFDEALLANNIIGRSYEGLLHPLNDDQVAPILYLMLTKSTSLIIPESEIGLRLVPFLFFCFAVLLFYKTLLLLFSKELTITFCLSLFLFNSSLIYYSSEVKQYTTDLFVAILLIYIVLCSVSEKKIAILKLLIFGSLSIYLSNITPIILLSLGIYTLIIYKKHFYGNKQIFYSISILFFFWLLNFVFYFFCFIYNHPTKDFMQNYWGFAFLPYNPFSSEFYNFLWTKFEMIFTVLLHYKNVGYFLLFLFLIALIRLFKGKFYLELVLFFLPVIIHLILSAFAMYPFEQRLLLYMVPSIVIIIGFSVEYFNYFIETHTGNSLNIFWQATIPTLLLLCSLQMNPLPYKNDDIKRIIEYVMINKKNNHSVYVYHGAIPAFNYYKNSGIIDIEGHFIYGNKYSKDEAIKYFYEIVLQKKPFWIIFSQDNYEEEKIIIQTLKNKGVDISNKFNVHRSSTYLFE